jgi:hypothetical protein
MDVDSYIDILNFGISPLKMVEDYLGENYFL